jgi:hypothetical protein
VVTLLSVVKAFDEEADMFLKTGEWSSLWVRVACCNASSPGFECLYQGSHRDVARIKSSRKFLPSDVSR